jgi:DNA phosphorothioation-dependent restriction protein DptG
VQSNQADCLVIAERAQQLVVAMIESLTDQDETKIHQSLKDDLTRFERSVSVSWLPRLTEKAWASDLKGVLEILEALASPSRVTKIFKHMEHSQELLKAKEMLDHSFRRFQVSLKNI